ncbi:hypothetical protein, secreted [gut metagenome]|uniref:Lipoprotein n=1 Tax=gut metagenome TaxID=749906 RepID=J9C9K7_9ZZZZ
MKKLSYLLLLAFTLTFTACQQTKQGIIADINHLIETIDEEGAEYTEKQWEKVNQKFEDLCEEAEELKDWSVEETAELAKAKAKYLGVQLKKNSEKATKSAGKALEGLMEGLSD